MAAHTLLIPLVGLMQSWGSRSRFEDRDTHPEPTRSGVIGLVCAAMEIGRYDSLADMDLLEMGVRTEQPGRPMSDYQTAQKVRTADGNIKETVLSTRHYLADARFLVGLGSDDLTFLKRIDAALHNPKWNLSLGRRSYPLTLPPYLPKECGGSLRESVPLEAALRGEPWRRLSPRENPPTTLRLLIEDQTGINTFSDRPLHFGERHFGIRRVHISVIGSETFPPVEDHPCIYPS